MKKSGRGWRKAKHVTYEPKGLKRGSSVRMKLGGSNVKCPEDTYQKKALHVNLKRKGYLKEANRY